MKANCKYCDHIGQLGNTILFQKIIEDGKQISVPVCNKCVSEIPVIKRPK